MAQLVLTHGVVSLIDEVDLEWASQWKWRPMKSEWPYAVRTPRDGEPQKPLTICLHRALMERILGRPLVPNEEVDHKNRDNFGNRRENLRLANDVQQAINRCRPPGLGSRFRGVKKKPLNAKGQERKKPWIASINVGNKRYHLGTFASEKEAAYTYNEAAARLHGEFAHFNQVFS